MPNLIDSFSWSIIDEDTAIKQCDLSFFIHKGSAIPKDNYSFWDVEGLNYGQEKIIIIFYEGVKYEVKITLNARDRMRMFWHANLDRELKKYETALGNVVAEYKKCGIDQYKLTMKLGSEAGLSNSHNVWIMPGNPKIYNVQAALDDLTCINWYQSKTIKNIEVNDIVYIYSSAPVSAVTHKCIVNKVNISKLVIPDYKYYTKEEYISDVGPFIELQCIKTFKNDEMCSLESLRAHGLKGNIMGPRKLSGELLGFIESVAKNNTQTGIVGADDEAELVDKNVARNMSMQLLKKVALGRTTTFTVAKRVISEQRKRDPYISEYTKRIANGICQLCNCVAPFKTKSGEPYLESHHVIWLSKGGEDSIFNTVALCPNCHRKMHIVNDDHDVDILLKKTNTNGI